MKASKPRLRASGSFAILAGTLVSLCAAAPPASQPASSLPAFKHVLEQLQDGPPLLDVKDLVRLLGLDEKRAEAFRSAFDECQDERAKLRAEHGREILQIQQIMIEAAAAGGNADPDMLAVRLQEHEAFHRETLRVLQHCRQALARHLTPAEITRWEGLAVRQQLNAHGLAKVQLSAAQQQAMDRIYESAGRKLQALGEDRDHAQVTKIIEQAANESKEKVLTQEQLVPLGYPWF